MVKPTIIECNICEEKILLRFQLGYYNIPFICKCPNCGISINGFQDISNGNLIINGAKEIDSDLNQVKYYGNFSVEFLNKKITEFDNIEEIIKKDFSPFMRTASLFDNIEEYSQINEKINKFMNFKLGKWGTIYSLYELLFDGRIDYIKKEVSKYSNKYNIINELDACMALHQLFLINLHNILPENTLGKYIDLSQKIFNPEKYTEINDFINYVKTKVNFKVLNSKIIELYNRWITEFEKYMSVVSLCISDKLDKVDKDTFVMSTINFESMKSFYADSYELILDLMWIPIGLNNIYERGTYNLFNDTCGIENFDKYFSIKIKLNKNKALIDNEIFSIYLNTDRKIRNSISHYDYMIDNNNQKVIFLDNENEVEMYIVDFAKLCYENVILITYLNELYYSLKKYDYITMGMAPNIKF